jgi:hypothetical protein
MNAAIQLLRQWRGTRSVLVAARDLDCDPSYLSLLERGKRKPRERWRKVIEQVVGIPAHLWDEAGAHPRTVDRVSPNVNDTTARTPAPLPSGAAGIAKRGRKHPTAPSARGRELGKKTPPTARKGAA